MGKNKAESELNMLIIQNDDLKPNVSHAYSFRKANRFGQQGVVLFIAMIALVVMSLAGVALIRSVDTNSLITGNLSFKQTSITSASFGVESFTNSLGQRLKGDTYAQNDDRPNGYYSSCTNNVTQKTTTCDGALLTDAATWKAGSTSKLADIPTLLSPGKDAFGNTIEYIVERMCTQVGAASKSYCLVATRTIEGDSKVVLNQTIVGAPLKDSDLPVYRVTVKVTGPKNTTSFVQAFIS